MSTTDQGLLEKLKQLPPRRLAEVEDFIDFLRQREATSQLSRLASRVSEPSLSAVWDNDEDAVYDQL